MFVGIKLCTLAWCKLYRDSFTSALEGRCDCAELEQELIGHNIASQRRLYYFHSLNKSSKIIHVNHASRSLKKFESQLLMKASLLENGNIHIIDPTSIWLFGRIQILSGSLIRRGNYPESHTLNRSEARQQLSKKPVRQIKPLLC